MLDEESYKKKDSFSTNSGRGYGQVYMVGR